MPARKKQIKGSVAAFPARGRENRYSMYRLLVIILVTIICGLLLIIGFQYWRQVQTGEVLAMLENRIAELQEQQAALEEEVSRLQDLDYIETLARQRLGLVKPGEVIFQLED